MLGEFDDKIETFSYCRVKEWRVTVDIPLAVSTVSSLVPV